MKQNSKSLMQQVYETGFAVDDIVLYLDTHPTCQKGLKYYKEAVKNFAEAKCAYEKECGPLQKTESDCPDYFDWVNNPWPWEGGCD